MKESVHEPVIANSSIYYRSASSIYRISFDEIGIVEGLINNADYLMAVSQDGSRIAEYSPSDYLYTHLFNIHNINTGSTESFSVPTSDALSAWAVSFSPDNSKLVYMVEKNSFSESRQYYMLDISSGEIIDLGLEDIYSSGGVFGFHWDQNDLQVLYFTMVDWNMKAMQKDLKTGNITEVGIPPVLDVPCWSADRKKVAYTTMACVRKEKEEYLGTCDGILVNDLWIYDVNSKQSSLVATSKETIYNSFFSPDKSKVAYSSRDRNSKQRVYITSAQ